MNRTPSAAPRRQQWFPFSAVLAMLLPFGIATPGWGAERITIAYGPLERSISVASLERYAQSGVVEKDLKSYIQYVGEENEAELRRVLRLDAELSSTAVAQFLYTEQGETLLEQLGEVIRTDSNRSGFYALRAALVLAAAEPDGLTLLNVLEQFPLESVRVDLNRALRILGTLEELIRQTQAAIVLVEEQAELESSAQSPVEFVTQPDLRRPGAYAWQTQTLRLNDVARNRRFPVDLYLPLDGRTPVANAPVIVISHGLGSDRTSYAYLARQLASYGFAVAVPEHPGSSTQQLQALLQGSANQVTEPIEFVNRPLDIQFLLDELEYRSQSDPQLQNRLNLQQVGVVGQSLGGYTALALAGAAIDLDNLGQDCAENNALNLSLLLQCRALELTQPLPTLKDDRVKSVIAINPIGSSLLWKTNYADIQIPVMIISSSADTVSPALLEQIVPFTWLESDKYLLLLQGGTHFSTIDVPIEGTEAVTLPPEIIGPDPELAQTYLKAISVAFFDTYVANQSAYRPFLSATYASTISEDLLPLSLVRSLTAAQVAKVFREDSLQTPEATSYVNAWQRNRSLLP